MQHQSGTQFTVMAGPFAIRRPGRAPVTKGVVMARRQLLRSVLAVGVGVSLGLGLVGFQAGAAQADERGSVAIMFSESVVPELFKAGVFMYGAESVEVSMGNSGALAASFPLTGDSTSRPTTSISVDGEVGGISFYNGPAEATAGLGSLVVRRTGRTGTVTGKLIGPFSMESGQFAKTMTVFTISGATARRTSSGWQMQGTLTLTADAASTLNTLLKTTVFTASAPIGEIFAQVQSR